MNKKKKNLLLWSSIGAVALTVGVVALSPKMLPTAGDNGEVWKHYAKIDSTVCHNGCKEYWVSCTSHEKVFEAPTSGTIEEGEEVHDKTWCDSLASNDARLISRKAKIITFDEDSDKDYVINGSRTTFGANDKTIVNDETLDSKCLKIVTTNTTFSCSFLQTYLDIVFAEDSDAVALNFECKTEEACTKLSYANSVSCPYEYNCCTNDQPGYGGQTFWKTFSLTKDMYNNKPSGQNCLVCTVGGQLPVGKAIYFDNIRPSTTAVNLYGFEGSRMVPKDTTSSHYKKSVSFRDFSNAELFTITTGYADEIDFGFDYTYKTEGIRSIHYQHKPNTNVWLVLPQLDLTTVDTVSFDICLSKAYNGNTVRDGKGNELFPASKVYQAYQWVTFTVNANQISDAKQFCTVTSSVECDFWVDNIVITTK